MAVRLQLMGSKAPEFAPADNPSADCSSPLTRTLTFLHLPAFNLWLLIQPSILSFDWSMEAIPLIHNLVDIRNLISIAVYLTLAYAGWNLLLRRRRSDRFESTDAEPIYHSTCTLTNHLSTLISSTLALPPSTATTADISSSSSSLLIRSNNNGYAQSGCYSSCSSSSNSNSLALRSEKAQAQHYQHINSWSSNSGSSSSCSTSSTLTDDNCSSSRSSSRSSNQGSHTCAHRRTNSRSSSTSSTSGSSSISTTQSSWPNSSKKDLTVIALSMLVLPFIPATNLFFYVGFVVAERVLYIPSMGYCLLVALGYQLIDDRLLRRERQQSQHRPSVHPSIPRLILRGSLVALLLIFSARTIVRNQDWLTEESLYRSGISINPPKGKY